MKKILSWLATISIVSSGASGVMACNTKTIDRTFSDLSSINTIWTNSYVNAIPLSLLQNNEENNEDSLKEQIMNLLEFRISNWSTFLEQSDNFEFVFKYEGIEIDFSRNETLESLVDKYGLADVTNVGLRIPLTFAIRNTQNPNSSTNNLSFYITNLQTISLNRIENEDTTFSISQGIEQYLELKNSDSDDSIENGLFLNESEMKQNMTIAELQSLAYQSLLDKINNDNYAIYINRVWTQVDANTFELQFRPMTLETLINYILNPVRNLDSKLTFNEGGLNGENWEDNSSITAQTGISRLDNFWVMGTKMSLRSISTFNVISSTTENPTPDEEDEDNSETTPDENGDNNSWEVSRI